MFFDPMYFVILAPALILSLIATGLVKSTFAKYAKVAASSRMTGAQAAAVMLTKSGVTDVQIERVQGFLSDHYDPTAKKLRLSPDVYDGRSLSAIGVACHEAGHALQHATHYSPLALRSSLVPVAQIGSNFSYVLLLLGFIMQSQNLLLAGIILFSAAVLFTIVTLPVEWNASTRAKQQMVTCGIVRQSEAADAGKVLNAAFLTYVASAASAVLTLIYYLYRSGLLGGRRD